MTKSFTAESTNDKTMVVRVHTPALPMLRREFVERVTTTTQHATIESVPEWKRALDESRAEAARGEGVHFDDSDEFIAMVQGDND